MIWCGWTSSVSENTEEIGKFDFVGNSVLVQFSIEFKVWKYNFD